MFVIILFVMVVCAMFIFVMILFVMVVCAMIDHAAKATIGILTFFVMIIFVMVIFWRSWT